MALMKFKYKVRVSRDYLPINHPFEQNKDYENTIEAVSDY